MHHKIILLLRSLFGTEGNERPTPSNVEDETTDIFEIAGRISAANEGKPFQEWDVRELTIVTICGLEAEVNNGGFDQYYFNSAGETSFFAEQALTNIGALKTADIARRANLVLGEPFPSNDELRQQRLLALSQEEEATLEDLDVEFFEYRDDIGALLATYWHDEHLKTK